MAARVKILAAAHLRHQLHETPRPTSSSGLVGYFTDSRLARGYPVLGIADRAGRLVAAANVNPPTAVPSPPALERRFASLREQLGVAAITRFQAFASACSPLAPREPHYYLGMLGVVPEHQGCGHARRLLEAVHEMSAHDRGSKGVSLTTEHAGNVELYEHFGYRVLGRAVTDDGELESWAMFRVDSSER